MNNQGQLIEAHFEETAPSRIFWIKIKPNNRVMISIIGIHETHPIKGI